MRKKLVLFLALFSISVYAHPNSVQILPLKNYNQDPNHFFPPDSPDYNKNLFDEKILNERIANYKEHLFGALSPWSEDFITTILNATPTDDLQTSEIDLFNSYRNGCDTASSKSFGEHFKPYPCKWFDNSIFKNMKLDQFKPPLQYNKRNRAIATNNILSRRLPTIEPIFMNSNLAGEGYPFDLAQQSAIWLGTPLYVFGRTDDGLWSLVVTNGNFIAWVPSTQIAFVNDSFIKSYSKHIKTYGLRVITHTETKIKNAKGNSTLFNGYIGSIFPGDDATPTKMNIPVRKHDGFAEFESTIVDAGYAEIFPQTPTPQNFVKIFNELVGRPYGWGGLYFYNDCSQELQGIFTTFGIWLPRFSTDEVHVGKIEDLSALNTVARLARLSTDGQKLTTLVYIKGHIMLYVGNYDYFGALAPTVYNQVWGLRDGQNSYRTVIGQAAFLPLLDNHHYSEDSKLMSFADSQSRPIFKLSFLNQWPEERSYALFGASNGNKKTVDVRDMVFN